MHDQITSRDTKFETSTKTILLQPFNPVVIAADETERIRYDSLLCFLLFCELFFFKDYNYGPQHVSKMRVATLRMLGWICETLRDGIIHDNGMGNTDRR